MHSFSRKKSERRSMNTKVGRNDPCPCGSGKKYKQCCAKNKQPAGRRRFKATVLNAKSDASKQDESSKENSFMLNNGPDLIARTYAKKEDESQEAEASPEKSEGETKDSP